MPNPPKRGEIWFVKFDPTIGNEIKKTRRAVVISSDSLGVLKVKIVVPLTEWAEKYTNHVWHVKIEPSSQNHLKNLPLPILYKQEQSPMTGLKTKVASSKLQHSSK